MSAHPSKVHELRDIVKCLNKGLTEARVNRYSVGMDIQLCRIYVSGYMKEVQFVDNVSIKGTLQAFKGFSMYAGCFKPLLF